MILSPRYVPRLAATVGLFTRYGLADFAKQQGLEGLAREPEPGEDHGGSPDVARAFRKRLVELGPAYIKLGQVLSTRPDLLPDSYIRELEKLQDAESECQRAFQVHLRLWTPQQIAFPITGLPGSADPQPPRIAGFRAPDWLLRVASEHQILS